MFEPSVFYAVAIAGILGAIGLGGGIYETLLVDRVWPSQPVLIQPERGGINRKLFWGPIHGLFEVALLLAVWLTWAHPAIRIWIWLALAVHLAARIWSFAYFIPMALRFETEVAGEAKTASKAAMKWVRLSRWRLPIEFLATLFLFIALAKLAGN
ncbi:hypothetical protein O8B93_13415 [Agrobacterium rhizogenes]|uniref:hypothetical protein n=1 Tax=Rhizobium rhizogenes TaxID=359 RepID=UPI0022B6A6BE|nr:hypothetical protein [Rhizobium rhizogenes]MCZ7448583.1 hypothetical protein [Rhizobium rhizogenes]